MREKIRFYFGFTGGAVWLVICSLAGFARIAFGSLFRSRRGPGRRDRSATTFYARLFCRRLARAVGWTIVVDRPELLEESRPCVFVANHQSILDIIVFGAIVPAETVAVGKKEIGRIPFFGWFFRAAGNLIVDRGRSEQTAAALETAGRIIREERIAVWLMPEGHRNAGAELLPFKTGAFRLAAAAGVPLVPLVAEPLGVVVSTRERRTRRGTLRIRVLDPVAPPAADAASIAATAAETRRRMQEALDSLRASAGT